VIVQKTHYCTRCLTTFYEDSTACPNLSCGRDRPGGGWSLVLGKGDLLDRHYLIERALAVGGAGITYKAREVDSLGVAQPPDLAIKVLYAARASGSFLRRLSNEAHILRELQHDNIVDCRGFVHRTGAEPYLVTLFEEGGSLADHVRQVGAVAPGVAAGIVRQILLALDQAHERGIIHRDLKPDNVLLREAVPRDVVPSVRVADFGIAKVAGGLGGMTQLGAFVGTPEYAAPEQFQGQRSTPATDVFAVGGLLYFLVAGEVPVRFSQRADPEACLEELLLQVPPKVPSTAGISGREREALQRLIDRVMQPDPEARWTVHQTLRGLQTLVPRTHDASYSTLELTDRGAPSRNAAPGISSPTFTADWTEETPKLEEPDALVSPVRTEWVQRGVPEAPAEVPPPPPPPPPPAPPPQVDPLPAATRPAAEPAPSPLPSSSPASAPPVVSGATAGVAPGEGSQPVVGPTPQRPTPAPTLPPPMAGTSRVAASSRGCLGAMAGVFGLGVAGAGVVTVAGSVVSALILGVAAWWLGWFGASAIELAPVRVDVSRAALARSPRLLGSDDPAWRRARARIQSALDAEAAAISQHCGVHGPLVAALLVGADGRIEAARSDLPTSTCVERALIGLRVPNAVGESVAARVGLFLGD
jgi:serine/threonine protein kinase